MNKTTLSFHTGIVLILLVCIADCLSLKDSSRSNHRQRRGFRMNAASRVAHGYGKRDFPDIFSNKYPSLSDEDKVSDLLQERSKSSFLSAQDFSRLLQSNEQLADIIVRKFIDINDDDMVSTEELFRRVRN